MRFRDTNDHLVFDTEERLMAITNRVSGSIGLSARTATNTNGSNSGVNVDTSHSLSSIDATADVVRGSFFVSTASGDGTLYNIGWFNASGTYVHAFEHIGPIGGPITTQNQIAAIIALTFKASGGTLSLRERVILRATTSSSPSVTFSITTSAITLSYNLFTGFFV